MKTPRDRFIAFLHAREEMRIHKELIGGPGPHSPDPILADHRFCNINREHDTVTKYIHQAFRVPFKDRGKQFMVRQMLFCRIFNQPDVLAQVRPFSDRDTAVKLLKAYRSAGHKMMRGAYMMPPHGKNVGGVDIIDHWCDVVEQATGTEYLNWPAIKREINYDAMNTLQAVADGLMTVCGVGAFIANQVCTDLRYIPIWGRSWTDWQSFILCGPGTRRGINRYYSQPLTKGGSDASFTLQLQTIREELRPDLTETLRDYFIDPNNLSNSFCEFDKYERAVDARAKGDESNLRRWEAADDGQLLLL